MAGWKSGASVSSSRKHVLEAEKGCSVFINETHREVRTELCKLSAADQKESLKKYR